MDTNRLQVSGVVPALLGCIFSFTGVAVSGTPIALSATNRLHPLSNAESPSYGRRRQKRERTHTIRRIGQTETTANSVELLTPPQVCELLHVSESTFFRLVRCMAFPVVHLRKSLRVRRTSLETYLAKMES